jgi:ABC-type phosphate transport system permease subunit
VGIGILSARYFHDHDHSFIASVMRMPLTTPVLQRICLWVGLYDREVVSKVVLPTPCAGVVGGIMLGLGTG